MLFGVKVELQTDLVSNSVTFTSNHSHKKRKLDGVSFETESTKSKAIFLR